MLRNKFNEDLKDAMRARDALKTSTIRLILAAIKERDILARSDGNQTGIEDSDIIALIHKMIKQRQQSIDVYMQANRPELAEVEKNEITVIQAYLPVQLTEAEIKTEIERIMKEIDATGMKDMKRVIEALKDSCGDRVDMAKASVFIREKLAP